MLLRPCLALTSFLLAAGSAGLFACGRNERPPVPAESTAPASAPAPAPAAASAVAESPAAADLAGSSPCAFYSSHRPDSLSACLTRFDSLARACPVVHDWKARLPDGVARRVEWRRCGPQGGAFEGDSIVWPTHYLLARQDASAASPVVFVLTNLEEPGISGFDTVDVADLDGDGSDEVFIVNQVYGTGAIFEDCALTMERGTFRCWSGPEFPARSQVLQPGERTMKGWMRQPSGPGDSAGSAALHSGGRAWYWTPIYRDGDPNCCPSAHASLWVEAIPRGGRFVTGLWLRTTEDSLENILGIDTLRR